MPRKGKKKRKTSEKHISRFIMHPHTLEHKLVENLIALQDLHVNLSEKFDKLTDHISALLELFESAAKSIAENPDIKEQTTERDKEFLEKIDQLMEQNKVIAKGLTLMEQRIREKMYGPMNFMKPRVLSRVERSKSIPSEYQPTQKIE